MSAYWGRTDGEKAWLGIIWWSFILALFMWCCGCGTKSSVNHWRSEHEKTQEFLHKTDLFLSYYQGLYDGSRLERGLKPEYKDRYDMEVSTE